MKILFCEVRHFSPNFRKCIPNLSVYIFTGSKTIFAKKKSDFFSPKILDFRKKKVAWTTKPLGGRG